MFASTVSSNEQQRLKALANYDLVESSVDPALDALAKLAALALGVPMAAVSIVGADRIWFRARHGIDAEGLARERSLSTHVVTLEQSLVVSDLLSDARFADHPLVLGDPRVRAYAGCPLRSPEGFVLGSLYESGIVSDANPATQALLGYAPHEIVGEEWMRHIAMGATGVAAKQGSQELVSGERRAFEQGSELTMRRKDGSFVDVELTLGVMRSAA